MDSIGHAATGALLLQPQHGDRSSISKHSPEQLAATSILVERIVEFCEPTERGDPELFNQLVTAVMLVFSWQVQDALADPTRGLITKIFIEYRDKGVWLPFTERVRMAGEREQERLRKIAYYEAMGEVRQRARLPRKAPGTIGDGGPGTVYSDFELAFAKHGRPTGPFEGGRECDYKATQR